MKRTQYTLFWLALIGPLLLLTFVWITGGTQPVYAEVDIPRQAILAQQNVATTQVTDTQATNAQVHTYTLPFDWQGEASIAARDLAATAPPLQAIQVEGDFQIAYAPTETGSVIRLLAPGEMAGQPRHMMVIWPLTSESTDPPLPRNSLITATVTARLYSPPEGADLLIRVQAGEWSASRVTMNGIEHMTYTVTRTVGSRATEVQIGIEWQPAVDNAWIELSDFRVAIQRLGEPEGAEESTGTGVPEEAPGEPEATPTRTPTPSDTPSPIPTNTPTAAPSLTPTPLPTLTPLVVTSTPTPKDIFEQATRVAMATEWARVIGPATATPENMVTATFTPSPIVITNTPTPENEATATYNALLATAVAATTGTPTPLPTDAVVLLATDTPSPTPRAAAQQQARATNTPTPIFLLLDDIQTPTPRPTEPMPEVLIGKILFLSDYFSGNPRQPNAFVINPDGTGLGVLTQRTFYNQAAARDAYSADRRFFAYSLREGGGAAHNAGLFQIFYDDAFYGTTQHQATYFGSGTAWAPAWSPREEVIAFVSSESANDEIWIVRRNEWPAFQLTKNEWEWDHHPSFSPDGSKIVFHSNRVTGTRQLWTMGVDGSEQYQLTNLPAEAWDPVWVKYRD